jgi:hypothetical protein
MRHFFAQVVGDGRRTDRSAAIGSCQVGEPLLLVPDPTSHRDENAVRVVRGDGQPIGYLERGLVARFSDDPNDFRAFVAGLDRSGGGSPVGVSILIVVSAGAADVEQYAQGVLSPDPLDSPPPRRLVPWGRPASGRTDTVIVLAVFAGLTLVLAIGAALRAGLVQ